MAEKRRQPLLDAVRTQIEDRAAGPLGDLKAAQEILTYLSWLAWHRRKFAEVPSFPDAARADIVTTRHAPTIGRAQTPHHHALSVPHNPRSRDPHRAHYRVLANRRRDGRPAVRELLHRTDVDADDLDHARHRRRRAATGIPSPSE